MENYKYILWIGDVDDHYDNHQEALYALEGWQGKGYDDVRIETISLAQYEKD